MKEVKALRSAGPFNRIPFDEGYVQSPVGLFPKAGNQTRLIFHLSYDFKNSFKSINHYIPADQCSVKYNDLDHVIRGCLRLMKQYPKNYLWFGISDLKSAFHLIPLKRSCWPLLLMKVRNPITKEWQYFVDKCLPFRASISCTIFQCFLNVLAHITHFRLCEMTDKSITNYLDDFLNLTISEVGCNNMLRTFHELCGELKVPLAKEKMVWATLYIVFLGILLNGRNFLLALPVEKVQRAIQQLHTAKDKKKITVHELQQLTGLLNFLSRAINPDRAFTRRMYAKISGKLGKLKPHHHIYLDVEFRGDCELWLCFLQGQDNGSVYSRAFIDMEIMTMAQELHFYTDSSVCASLGFGAVLHNEHWLFGQWELVYIKRNQPSIAYLELFAVCMGIFAWSQELQNRRLLPHCDNKSVVSMINNTTSGCKHCMHLVRLLVLQSLRYNFKIYAVYVESAKNELADSLSRLQLVRFKKLCAKYGNKWDREPTVLPRELWPASRIWDNLQIA